MDHTAILNSADDWKWYKAKLDLADRYDFRHDGAPTEYPCKVESEKNYDDNGHTIRACQDWYSHDFVYLSPPEPRRWNDGTLVDVKAIPSGYKARYGLPE